MSGIARSRFQERHIQAAGSLKHCLPIPTQQARAQAVQARGEHTHGVIDVITHNRTCDEVLTSLGMAEGTG